MKGVQGDFVAMRQAAGGITVEDFHNLLVLARLVAKGHGRDSLLQVEIFIYSISIRKLLHNRRTGRRPRQWRWRGSPG